MLAVKHSLTGAPDRKVMYCIMCGAQYSADPGDYWDHPDDYIFTCCGTPMVLGKIVKNFIEAEVKSDGRGLETSKPKN